MRKVIAVLLAVLCIPLFSCSRDDRCHLEKEVEYWEYLTSKQKFFERDIEKIRKEMAEEENYVEQRKVLEPHYPSYEKSSLKMNWIREAEDVLRGVRREKTRLLLPYIGFLVGTPYYEEILEKI